MLQRSWDIERGTRNEFPRPIIDKTLIAVRLPRREVTVKSSKADSPALSLAAWVSGRLGNG
jgi:hypothetical protein